MRALLGLAAASAAFFAFAPAQAESVTTSGFSASSAFRGIRFGAPSAVGGVPLDVRRHGRHIRVGDVLAAGGYGYGGYYDGDYDANRSFSPDKWNDWWHERPERAFPRWMSENRNCERMWYSGAGWRC